jgi:hypothetical protein
MQRPSLLSCAIIAGVVLAQLASGHADPLPIPRSTPATCPPPAPPSSFWGYVTLDGAAALAGQQLAARIDGIEVASTTTQAVGSTSFYQVDVPARAYDTVTGQVCRPGGAAGETITFVLAGSLPASETGAWAGGTLVHRDLMFWSCSLYDFDCDCHIAINDLSAIVNHWNCYRSDACYDPTYDLDRDNDVDVIDVMAEAGHWSCDCGEACYR